MKVTRVFGLSVMSSSLVIIYEDSKIMFTSLGVFALFKRHFLVLFVPRVIIFVSMVSFSFELRLSRFC